VTPPRGFSAAHCHHWSASWVLGFSSLTDGSSATGVVEPVKLAPASVETLTTMSLLQPSRSPTPRTG
jgi:hypothetical protein